MNSSKVALAILLTAMFILTFLIRNFVTGELSSIERSVQTVQAIIESFAHVQTNIEKLRDRGIKICLDDFGTGYSSINYLTRLPLDILKLDKSLILGLDSNQKAQVVLANLISMAHGIGIQVVAEGLETQAQVNLIRSLGCDLAQGYFYGRPSSAEDVITKWNEKAAKRIAG